MAPRTRVFPFFDLPAELRSAVLFHLLVSDQGIVLHTQTLHSPPLSGPRGILSVFLVNLQMYQEASAIFYTNNLFILNAQSHRLPIHLTGEGGFLSAQAQDARRRVHSLTLYLSRVGGEFEDILGPALSDMVLCGKLRALKLCLGAPAARSLPQSDMIHRPPFQSLLKLLSDPDLENVDFLISKVHWAILCPFHQSLNSIGGEKPLNELIDEDGLATARNGAQWIPLDWGAMVNTLGDGRQVTRKEERIAEIQIGTAALHLAIDWSKGEIRNSLDRLRAGYPRQVQRVYTSRRATIAGYFTDLLLAPNLSQSWVGLL
ncbi:hypothetical protein F4780DRAFT_778851 [Xylariomycetidae sp. FL0641]|nr:hypothetical protein F4780DRAFT_778851 [Xylariomycetidae sp. FL0641]